MRTNPTSSATEEMNDNENEAKNHIETMDLRQIVDECENDNRLFIIDQSTEKQEDENNNDKIDHSLIQISCSPSDYENLNSLHSPIEKQTSIDSNHEEAKLQQTTTNLATDNHNLSKR